MAIVKKLKQIAKKLKKRPKTHYPPMPEDPRDLAQAMFTLADKKLTARMERQQEEGQE